MLPSVVLVGRPNVGKSTVFNRLTNRRDALVADVPGLTRDRRYAKVVVEIDDHERAFNLIDTGGLFGDHDFSDLLQQQAQVALEEADFALFLVDAQSGVTAIDYDIAKLLRRQNIPSILVVNKIDGRSEPEVIAEFSQLGWADEVQIAAAHNRGMHSLLELLIERMLIVSNAANDGELVSSSSSNSGAISVAIVGRPNVGKSTLTNRLLGEERQVVFDAPGTTVDAIAIPFQKAGDDFVLIDTAGVRRKGRTDGVVEKFSIVKTLQAIDVAEVVILVLDANEGVVDQDLHLLSYALERGAGVLVAMNKWDGLSGNEKTVAKTSIDRRLDFVPWIDVKTISALHGTGVGVLLKAAKKIYEAGRLEVSPSVLTRMLTSFTESHVPPAIRGRSVKLRYAHKVGSHPPHIVIHGNQTESLPASYKKYLENSFRAALGLASVPVRLSFRTGTNPYAGKRNPLTKRQQSQRQRVIGHRKSERKRKR